MATTINQVAKYLSKANLKFKHEAEHDRIYLAFDTDTYVDTHGRKQMVVYLELKESGEFLRVFVPNCYLYRNGPHEEAVFQSCLIAGWRSKMVRFQRDPQDGEIRASIDVPLEDAKLTQAQVNRYIAAMTEVIERYHPMIQGAIDTGRIVEPAR